MSLDKDWKPPVARRPLHFILVADCSGSMDGEKIQSLNQVVRDVIPAMVAANNENAFAEVLVRVLCFSSGAFWRVSTPTSIMNFHWEDLSADGVTDLGAALDLLAADLTTANLGRRNRPPILVLLSDGGPTDDWESALQRFNATEWGKPGRTVRVAIAIGVDADEGVLARFTGSPGTVFLVRNARQLTDVIQWVSITLPLGVSNGSVMPEATGTIAGTPLPVVTQAGDEDEPW